MNIEALAQLGLDFLVGRCLVADKTNDGVCRVAGQLGQEFELPDETLLAEMPYVADPGARKLTPIPRDTPVMRYEAMVLKWKGRV